MCALLKDMALGEEREYLLQSAPDCRLEKTLRHRNKRIPSSFLTNGISMKAPICKRMGKIIAEAG